MGTPPSSLNCLLGPFFLAFSDRGAAEGGAMRVPSPAAGTMTNTFIRGDQYSTSRAICVAGGGARRSTNYSAAYSATRSAAAGVGFFIGSVAVLAGTGGTATADTEEVEETLESRCPVARSSHLPKIILPAVVCRTEVTDMSMVLPIILRALSMTTMVPSSK